MENTIICGDAFRELQRLPDGIVDCCVTSPPYYGLRDYGISGQIGMENSPQEYIGKLVDVFREVKRVLKDDGTLWLNIGDSYAAQRGGSHQPAETLAGGKHGYTEDGASVNRGRSCGYNPTRDASAIGLKHKDLIGIPWMLAFALRADGWYLRQDIIWAKPNPMPESVKDRCTKSHEYIFLLSKQSKYYFDYEAIQEDAATTEMRPAGIVREREYGYDSKRNVHPEAYLAKRAASPLFGGNKYGKYDDTHYAVYSGNKYVPSGKRNKRDVWNVSPQPTKELHFATFPEKLIEPCILAGSRVGGGGA